MDLDKLLEQLGAHAHNVLLIERQDELMPIYHLCTPGERDMVIGTPWRNEHEKLLSLRMIKAKARDVGATAIGFLSEVWMSRYERDDPSLDMNNILPPSQDPKRVECVFAVVTDGNETKSRSWEMVRGPNGKIVALKKNDLDTGMLTGRMIDGLLPKRTQH